VAFLAAATCGLWTTVTLTILATIGGVSLGILGAALRSGKPTLASHIWGRMSSLFVIRRSWCSSFYRFRSARPGAEINGRRGGVDRHAGQSGAYSTEIIRAGIQVAPKGQWEAARVLGLTKAQTFFRVILPPSLRRIYPALVSQCIIVMLGSSVVSQVSYEELTFAANLIQSRTF
jgi:polar amino acid transport system permease protein